MAQQGLFAEVNETNSDESSSVISQRHGSAGHHLVLADLQIRGHEAGLLDGVDTDIIAVVGSAFRKFQVKASKDGSFHSGHVWNAGGARKKTFTDYQGRIDGFAFVHLNYRAVCYVHPNAIITPNLVIHNWGRQHCDMSFDELLKRWDCF